MKNRTWIALGLGWALSTGPFLWCERPAQLCAAEGDPVAPKPPMAGPQPQKDDAGNTIFSLIEAKDLDRLPNFLDRFPTALRDRNTNRDTPLHAAIDVGSPEVIAFLLGKGVDTESLDARLATPLITCTKKKDLATAKLLIDAKVKLDVKDVLGYTALHYAVLANQIEMVDLLAAAGASIDVVERKKALTPVHLALTLGRDNLAFRMIQATFTATTNRHFFLQHLGNTGDLQRELVADPTLVDRRVAGGWSLLHQAVLDDDIDSVSYLLSQGADFYARDCALRCALHYAAALGKLEIAQRLMERHGDVAPDANVIDERKVTPLAMAVQNGHIELCKFLLSKGANANIVDADGKNLAFVLATCDDAMADVLAGATMDLNLRDGGGRTPLYFALGNSKRVQLMLKLGAAVNPKDQLGRSLLHAAAAEGNVEVCQLLIERGVPLDEVDNHKRTALHTALVMEHPDVAQLLIAKGANIEAEDDDGATPIHYSVYNLGGLTALLKRHARVDQFAVKTKSTPLMAAKLANEADAEVLLNAYLNFFETARTGSLEALRGTFDQLTKDRDAALKAGNQALAQALTDAPASLIGARNNAGATPLMVAAGAGNVETAKFLFQCGADPKAKQLDGSTAMHLAAKGNAGPMIALLLSKQLDPSAANANQDTPLHLAVGAHAVDAIKVLVGANANKAATDQNGRTPAQLAQIARTDAVNAKTAAETAKDTAKVAELSKTIEEFDQVIATLGGP